jgi:hypothetical protein
MPPPLPVGTVGIQPAFACLQLTVGLLRMLSDQCLPLISPNAWTATLDGGPTLTLCGSGFTIAFGSLK